MSLHRLHALGAVIAGTLAFLFPARLDAQVEFVADINEIGNSSPGDFFTWNGKLYFSARDGVHFPGIFSYDGSMVRAEDLTVRFPGGYVLYDGAIYLQADTDETGYEFWRFDGTDSELIADITPGSGNSFPGPFVHFQDKLFFRADKNSLGPQMYSFDGTKVVQVTDTGFATPRYIAYGDELVLDYFRSDVGVELFRFDGTNLTLISDINPAGDSVPLNHIVYDGMLYFGADDGSGYELWRYDGVSAVKVTDGAPGFSSGVVHFDGKIYFAGPNGLWSYDGVIDQMEVPLSTTGDADVGVMYASGDHLYFGANFGSLGVELLSWDGTRVELIADINQTGTAPWFGDSDPRGFGEFQGGLYFGASDGDRMYGGHELFRIVPTAGEARVVVAGNGSVDFGGGTALDIDFAGVARGSDTRVAGDNEVHVRRYHGGLLWVDNLSDTVVSPDHWRIESDIIFDNTTALRIKLSEIPDHGLGDPAQLVVYSRPVVADGNFSQRTTTYEPATDELVVAGFTQFGEFVITGDQITPVVWLAVHAAVDGRSVRIAWDTSLGAAADRFTLERAIDGLHFGPVVSTDVSPSPGGGFLAVDEAPPWHAGVAFYRVRYSDSVDESVSPMMRVTLDGVVSPALTSHPNPFATRSTILFHLANDGPVRLRVYDVGGRLVKTLVDDHRPSGRHVYVLEGSVFPSGAYYYVLESGHERRTHRAVISR